MVNATNRNRKHENNESVGLVLPFFLSQGVSYFQLFRRRINATKDYEVDPLLKTLLTSFWPYCTPEVMSDDETDSEWDGPADQIPHFIKVMNWRNPVAVDFFRVFDALYFSTRFKGNKWSPGRFPHTRVPSVRLKECNAIPGLPVNFYSPQWLLQLSDIELRKLNARPAIELDFSQNILRCVWSLHFIQHLTVAAELLLVSCIFARGSSCHYLATILRCRVSQSQPTQLVSLSMIGFSRRPTKGN
jgi:hypothetical protein